jgi:hypothetical protein
MPSIHARLQSEPMVPRSGLRLLPGVGPGMAPGMGPESHAHSIQSAVETLPLDADWSRTLAALGGDAARKRLHALHPARPGDEGAVTGFAFALLGGWARSRREGPSSSQGGSPLRPILWVQDRTARAEAGRPYGLGFAAFGIDPAQLVLVSTKGALNALAAVEMGLEIGALDGVLVELPPSLPADMLALGKRLALRAERSMTPCLLLHASQRAVSMPVATRWEIAGLPAVPGKAWEAPVPVAALNLVKNRFGPTGRWSVPLGLPAAMSVSSQSVPSLGLFSLGASDVCVPRLAPSLPQSVAADTADRSHSAAPAIRAAKAA